MGLANLQTHPTLQWATTAAKHQLHDGAASMCWDGWRQHDTACKDLVPQQSIKNSSCIWKTEVLLPFSTDMPVVS